MTEPRDKMVRVAELLLERETITSVDMETICGKRKGRSPTNYSEIIRDVDKREKEKLEKEKSEKQEQEKEQTTTNDSEKIPTEETTMNSDSTTSNTEKSTTNIGDEKNSV